MKTTIQLHDFRNAFSSFRPDSFSYAGLETLFNYFEMIGEDCGTEIELDVIAIDCEYSEMTEEEIVNDYDKTPENLQEDTTVLEVGNGSYIICTSF